MPIPEIAYLVQGPDGRCVTVQARSPIGAVRRFLLKYSASLVGGDHVSVKPRGSGTWVDYQVKR